MSVSVDPDHSLIYTANSVPGAIAALELTASGPQTVWMADQHTTEFLALIGPHDRRVLVDTDIPNGQCPLANKTDYVVWRDAQTGDELGSHGGAAARDDERDDDPAILLWEDVLHGPEGRTHRAGRSAHSWRAPLSARSDEFWRFLYVQQELAAFGKSFVQFPALQAAASFNLSNY